MGMFQQFCINKSGKTCPVYDAFDNNKYKGEIYNREAFILWGGEGDKFSIGFLGPNGYTGATLNLYESVENDILNPLFSGHATCIDYPYGTANIDGKNYYTFIMRKAEPIYHGDGTKWGSVAQNMLVATNNANIGSTHETWKEINYVMRSTDRQWIKVDGHGYNHGFVDTGLSTASGYSKIPFYGSW